MIEFVLSAAIDCPNQSCPTVCSIPPPVSTFNQGPNFNPKLAHLYADTNNIQRYNVLVYIYASLCFALRILGSAEVFGFYEFIF